MDPALRDRWLARAKERIAAVPGRHSGAARNAVLELLSREAQCLVEPQQLIDHLRREKTGSHASLYRILNELLGLGLLNRVDSRDGTARYEITDPLYHHHHFIDQETGEISPFHDKLLDDAIQNAAIRLGVELADHEITVRGTRLEAGARKHSLTVTSVSIHDHNGAASGWGLPADSKQISRRSGGVESLIAVPA